MRATGSATRSADAQEVPPEPTGVKLAINGAVMAPLPYPWGSPSSSLPSRSCLR